MASPPVTYDDGVFIGLFPEFTGLTAALRSAYFTAATGTIIANSATNPANADGNLAYLIYLATAHVAWLRCPKDSSGNPSSAQNALPASQQVGRISNASQGSVSAQMEWPANDPSAQEKYLTQTKYGAELWAALAQYRTAQYIARPTRVATSPFRFGSGLRPDGW